jgi:hypothetical protein
MLSAAFEASGSTRPLSESRRPNAGFGDAALEAGFSRLWARAAAGDETALFKRPDQSWDNAKRRYDSRQFKRGNKARPLASPVAGHVSPPAARKS